MSDDQREPMPAYEGFTLDELDEFGTMSGPNELPFSLDDDIWKDKRNRPLILKAIEERRRG
jgi:hypothetical protein